MTEATRRASCRLGFVLFCLLPTVLVVGWICVARSPGYRQRQRLAVESQLAATLGVVVQVDQLSPLAGGGLLLGGVRMTDPETDQPLATLRLLEVHEVDGAWKLLASQPEIPAAAVPRLWELLHDRLLRDREAGHRRASLAARELTLLAASGSQTFTDVQLQLEPSSLGPQLTAEFRLAGVEMAELAQVRVVRNLQLSPPATGWSLRTGGASLPCGLLVEWLPGLGRLGADCRFQGALWASQTAAGWEADVSGQFDDLDLYNLVSDSFPHKLTGRATAVVSVARMAGGQLIEASGELRSPHGAVSQSLLHALRDDLQLTLNEQALPAGDQRLLYQRLAVAYRLSDEGLTVTAVRDAPQSGVLLHCDQGWLLAESNQTSVPVVALVRALLPDRQLLVPAARQTAPLLQALPVPAA
ncbi:MAG: hypothetical protein J5I93_15365, partial [Pirellulaceae bacterium]|nr:hypothetical protein [Pirellulaceae bacterium]